MSLSKPLNSGTAVSTVVEFRQLPLVFAGTIFLSAFLLFAVQPLFTKMILPALGGSPAVWSVAMVFFQALLLLGYLYAHLSARWLSGAQALSLHGVLMLSAFLALPLSVSQMFGAPPDDGQSLWLIGVFCASVGLPFFVLAATAPLLQAWFARSGHTGASNPYSLYAASNLGSFFALLAYPLLIEPLFPLQLQNLGWMLIFAILGFGLLTCGVLSLQGQARSANPAAVATATQDSVVVSWKQRMIWTALAAIPSGLLISVTAHLSTDVASAPLLWVLPLAIFMMTFVLAFKDEPLIADWRLAKGMAWVTPFVVISLVGFILPLMIQFLLHLGILFLAAMLCHRSLYRSRPSVENLTEFYLWMSFGGMLGGLFAGLLAPLLFNTILEYRILLIGAMLCLPVAASAPALRKQWQFVGFGLVIGGIAIVAAPTIRSFNPQVLDILAITIAAAFLAIVIFNKSGSIASAGAVTAAFLVLIPANGSQPEAVVRSFFGVNYIKRSPDGQAYLLTHGSTIHGAHRILDLDGKPMTGRPQPTTYYHDDGGINIALKAARASAGGTLANVAVLGLGAGAMACQSAPRENWSFFEIDKEVVALARKAEHFPFLSVCTPQARIVLGDARLTLQKEAIKYDVIILDAFSSDAIPAHLLTKEAFAIYAERLNPDGMIIAHVSNRYMDIRSVAEAGGLTQGFKTASAAILADWQNAKAKLQLATPTIVVAMSRSGGSLEPLIVNGGWTRPDANVHSTLWTDDYANILGAMYRKWRKS